MTVAHWIFLTLSGAVILIAGVWAVIREIRDEGFVAGTWALRAFFLLVSAGIGYAIPEFAPTLKDPPINLDPQVSMLGCIIIFLLVFSAEVFAGTLNISFFVFGAMIGVIVAHLTYYLVVLAMEPMVTEHAGAVWADYKLTIKMLLSVVFAYLFVLLVYKNRDRFNFIIPYVEFRRERRGGAALLVDTSAIIDGRLEDLCKTGMVEGPLVVPRFVLRELHRLADSADKLKRARGRRGIDILNRLRKNSRIPVQIDEGRVPGTPDTDAKLIRLAETLGAKILTADINLNKIADVQGVDVVNLHHVARAVKPAVLPGETLSLELIRPGEAPDQAVGYMDDGTMVVVEKARERIGEEVDVVITRLLQTAAGRIIFAKLSAHATHIGRRDRGNQ
ncbi:MAG: TRAM domain-containing protein [Planctomycetota bacterium]